MITVAVVSASTVLAAGLKSLVEETGQLSVIASVGNVDTLLELEVTADVLLVDRPEESRLDRGKLPHQAMVIFSDALDMSTSEISRRGSGLGLLKRDAAPEQIRTAIMAAAAGLVVVEPGEAQLDALVLSGRSDPSQVEPVTPRETEVLSMLAEGLGNKMIARRLGISEHTVKFHVGSLMRKLSASSRTEAVTNGLRSGVLTV